MSMLTLSKDILYIIAAYLPIRYILHLGATCKNIYVKIKRRYFLYYDLINLFTANYTYNTITVPEHLISVYPQIIERIIFYFLRERQYSTVIIIYNMFNLFELDIYIEFCIIHILSTNRIIEATLYFNKHNIVYIKDIKFLAKFFKMDDVILALT